jgi:2-polyprenyl-3-methyl-5-hydroxy-6-metoxy-1,4-benzoquinol methylase
LRRIASKNSSGTKDREYSIRLASEESAWWKRILNVQAPYRWNLQRLDPGFTLDIGCGLGRNLKNLSGNGVGIDHNSHSVEIAKTRGFQAFNPESFEKSPFNKPASFDSILLSHVVEHMGEAEVKQLLDTYMHLLKPRGQVIFITPQEYGFRSDPTHIQFMDFAKLRSIASKSGLRVVREFSFPFPRPFGRFFKYNEFVCVCRRLE